MGAFLGVFLVTAYCCVGAGGGFCGATASGVQVGEGQVAADWRVLPRGTRVVVEGYGAAVVTDTGGDIKGQRFDVFYRSCDDARRWGRRNVRVYAAPGGSEGIVSGTPEWRELLDEVTYWDEDAWVVKRVLATPRGVVDTFEVLR
jgi:3D (Asp-Asp-Asp) domain-containing protein